MSGQPNNFIYYDALISNYNSPNSSIPLIFNDTRSSALIRDTTGYVMSIVRFALDTGTLPIFVPIMQTNSSTDTIYSITMTYNNISYQQYMNFIPQNTAQINNYYYVYSYQYLCNLINNTFASCLTGLMNLTDISNLIIAPTISYNSSSQLFTITLDDTNFGGSSSNLINIYFNSSMQSLFLFNSKYTNTSSSIGQNYLLINNGNEITQEISTLGNISPIMSIVFVSTQLPIIQNISGNPNIYINGQIQNQNSSNTGYNIITDMIPSDFVYIPNIIYVPSGQYRYISLTNGGRISNIDFQVLWLDKQGNLNQVYLNTGSSCSVKFLFQKIN